MAGQVGCRGDPVSEARRPAMVDDAPVLFARIDAAALVLPVGGQPAMVVAQSLPALDRARGDRAQCLAQRGGIDNQTVKTTES